MPHPANIQNKAVQTQLLLLKIQHMLWRNENSQYCLLISPIYSRPESQRVTFRRKSYFEHIFYCLSLFDQNSPLAKEINNKKLSEHRTARTLQSQQSLSDDCFCNRDAAHTNLYPKKLKRFLKLISIFFFRVGLLLKNLGFCFSNDKNTRIKHSELKWIEENIS